LDLLSNVRFWCSRFAAFSTHVWLGRVLRCRGVFGGFYIESEFRTTTLRNITIRRGAVIQRRTVFAVKRGAVLSVGSKTRIGSDCVVAVQERVELGNNVLIAARCLIADHNHQFGDPASPVMTQGAAKVMPVFIGDDSWVGINVCILPGVQLGKHCVVGANSVVTRSFPDYTILAGAPAKAVGVVGTEK
jgi:acetyltransferase-like isoleucine patch superfamily enzyme